MTDVFISYSKSDRTIVEALAKYLEAEGYRTWWDTSLISGESFRAAIEEKLNAAKAVIVLWSANSVASEWVTAEAEHALRVGNLVPVRVADLNPTTIPKPFNQRQTDIVDNRPAVLAALKKLGVEPRYASAAEGSLHDRFWKEIEHSQLVEDFEIYLKDFPDGPHVAFARLKIARLKRLSAASPEQKRVGASAGTTRTLTSALALFAFVALAGGIGWQALQLNQLRGDLLVQPSKADDADWAKADSVGLISGWKDYLAMRPLGRHAAEARARIASRLDGNRAITSLEGHDDAIVKITAGDGIELTSVGEKGLSIVWSSQTKEIVRKQREPLVPSETFSPFKQVRYSGSSPDLVLLGATFRVECCYTWHFRPVNTKAPGDDIYLGSGNDMSTIKAIALSRRFLIAELGSVAHLLDQDTGRVLSIIQNQRWNLSSITAATQAKRRSQVLIALGAQVQVRSFPEFNVLAWLDGHRSRVRALAFSEDGLRAYSGGDDGVVRVWDISDLP